MAQKKIPREKQGTHAKVMEAARLRAEADAFQELAAKREARAVKAELALPVWVDGKDGPRCEVSGVGRALLAAEKELARLRAEASCVIPGPAIGHVECWPNIFIGGSGFFAEVKITGVDPSWRTKAENDLISEVQALSYVQGPTREKAIRKLVRGLRQIKAPGH